MRSKASSFLAQSFFARPFCVKSFYDNNHSADNDKQADKDLWITLVSLPH